MVHLPGPPRTPGLASAALLPQPSSPTQHKIRPVSRTAVSSQAGPAGLLRKSPVDSKMTVA